MSSSEEYQRYKELYYEENLPVIEYSITGDEGEVVFSGGDGNKVVSGSADDFTNQLLKLVPTVRNGVEQFIELKETSAENTRDYYERMSVFSSDSDNPIEEVTARINSGELDPPEDLNWRSALTSSVQGEMGDPDLIELINNYFAAMALLRSDKYKKERILSKIRDNLPYEQSRFEKYHLQAGTILEDHYLTGSPLRCFKDYISNCETDPHYFSKRMMRSKQKSRADWDGLMDRDIEVDDGLMILFREKERIDGNHSEKVGQIEGEIGIEKILDQYSDLYELAREPLHDIAVTLSADNNRFGSFSNVLGFLENNEAQTFAEAIEPQLRHGSAHNQVDLEANQPTVIFYNDRSKRRSPALKMSYEEIFHSYYELVDMVLGLLLAFILTDYNVGFRYMGSKEFQYRVIERAEIDSLKPTKKSYEWESN